MSLSKKRTKKLLALMPPLIISGGLVSANTHIYAAEDHYIEKRSPNINFKPHYEPRDKVKAEAYSKERYSEWRKTLQLSHQKELEEFQKKINLQYLNKKLELARGNIENIKDSTLKQQLKQIDTMIKQPVNRTKEKQIIYTHFTAEELGFINESQMKKDDGSQQLDENKIENVLRYYEYGILRDLKFGNLMMKKGDKGQHFVVKLELPSGTYLGHLGDGQVILPSECAIEIANKQADKPKIIIVDGKQIIKVNAKLVQKAEIQEKIKEREQVLNDDINKLLNNDGSKIVKLDIEEISASYSMKQAHEAITSLVNNKFIPKEILKDGLLKLKSKDGLVFTDGVLKESSNIGGFYSPKDKNIYIKTNLSHHLTNQYLNFDVSHHLLHELGHLVDVEILGKGLKYLSANDEYFLSIYKEEKSNITNLNTVHDYAQESTIEFFAEVFKSMYSSNVKYRESIRKEAPEAVKYIEDKLKEYNYL